MKKVINCLKEHNPVINKKLNLVTLEEGLIIATELFEILNDRKDGTKFWAKDEEDAKLYRKHVGEK